MKHLDYIGNFFQYFLTITQTKEIFQIVSLVLSIITTCVIMGSKLINWWKEAKKDDKITKEELDEGRDILMEGLNDLKGLEEEADEYVEIVETQEECEKEVK